MLNKQDYEAVLAYNRRNHLLCLLAQHFHYHDQLEDQSIPDFDKLPRKGGFVSQERYYGEAEAELRKLEESRGIHQGIRTASRDSVQTNENPS